MSLEMFLNISEGGGLRKYLVRLKSLLVTLCDKKCKKKKSMKIYYKIFLLTVNAVIGIDTVIYKTKIQVYC